MKFTEEPEWLREEDGVVVVGITEHAAEQLGDIVFVELPVVGTEVAKDDEVVVIESVKAASDILAPIDGEVVEELLADVREQVRAAQPAVLGVGDVAAVHLARAAHAPIPVSSTPAARTSSASAARGRRGLRGPAPRAGATAGLDPRRRVRITALAQLTPFHM